MFQTIVSCLCDIYKENEELYEQDFDRLEKTLVKSDSSFEKEPFFRIFTCPSFSHLSSFDIDWNFFGDKYSAEYYDGFQAPFQILCWKADNIDELFQIIRCTAPELSKIIEKKLCDEEKQEM